LLNSLATYTDTAELNMASSFLTRQKAGLFNVNLCAVNKLIIRKQENSITQVEYLKIPYKFDSK